MKASNITRHSLVHYQGEIYMLENKPRVPILIPYGKPGIEIKRDTELEVYKYPAQIAMDLLKNKFTQEQ